MGTNAAMYEILGRMAAILARLQADGVPPSRYQKLQAQYDYLLKSATELMSLQVPPIIIPAKDVQEWMMKDMPYEDREF